MNTSIFLEVYKEIERLIQENLAEIRQAYEKYFFLKKLENTCLCGM